MDTSANAAIENIIENSVQANGIINIPLCSYEKAADNAGWGGPNEQNKGAAHYPCN